MFIIVFYDISREAAFDILIQKSIFGQPFNQVDQGQPQALIMFAEIIIGPAGKLFDQFQIERVGFMVLPCEGWAGEGAIDNVRAFLPPANNMCEQIMDIFEPLLC